MTILFHDSATPSPGWIIRDGSDFVFHPTTIVVHVHYLSSGSLSVRETASARNSFPCFLSGGPHLFRKTRTVHVLCRELSHRPCLHLKVFICRFRSVPHTARCAGPAQLFTYPHSGARSLANNRSPHRPVHILDTPRCRRQLGVPVSPAIL